MNNQVAIKYINNYNTEHVQKTLLDIFSSLNASKLIKQNSKILIKIDAGIDENPDKAVTTHPAVVQGMINILTDLGAQCIIADSPAKQYSLNGLDKIYFETGMLEVANSTKSELNHNLAVCKVEIPNGIKTKSATLLEVVEDVDYIVNIGKLHYDQQLGMYGVADNIFGLVPGDIKQLVLNRLTTVEDFNNYVIDLVSKLQQKIILNVFDGVVALESNESQRMLSCLAMGENMFSLESVINTIIGRDSADTIVKTASKRGMIDFENQYTIVDGELQKFVLDDFDFGEITNASNLHTNKCSQKRYFNRTQQRVVIDANKCKGCGRCASICPANAILMKYDKNGELYAKIDYTKCIFCNKCFTACPYSVADLKTPIGYKLVNYNVTKYNKEN